MLSTSINLLERLTQRDDRAAWERFVGLYSPLLVRWARIGGLKEADAADLVQDVFIFLWNELPAFRYDPGRGSFRGWLKTITLRACRDRRLRWSPPLAEGVEVDRLAGGSSQSDPLEEEEYRRLLVGRALELMRREFQPATWQACWEHAVSGKTAAEVGHALGLSEAAVYVAKSRVLRRLRLELKDLID